MCAINPKHKEHFSIDVYTSTNMSENEFLELIAVKILEIEQQLNADMRLRWHIS